MVSPMTTDWSNLPRYDELPVAPGVPAGSSWGLWGQHDVFGCLNLLTPERVVDAARLIQRGAVFPLNWDMRMPDPPLFSRARFEHEVTGRPPSVGHDDVLHGWNTQSSSQWDGFRHVRHPVHGHYGGVPDEEHGMHHWASRGLVGRAVLADVGRWRAAQGRPLQMDEPDEITPDDLLSTLAAQGSTIEPGDVLLMRTGWVGWYSSLDRDTRTRMSDRTLMSAPGIPPGEATARFLWDLHIAAIGADNPAVEIWPPGALLEPGVVAEVQADPSRMHETFVHTLLLPMLGLPLGEMWNLEPLAEDCASDGRYECFFSSAPLNLPAGVASPPNALAIK